jgi:hypothetical protein
MYKGYVTLEFAGDVCNEDTYDCKNHDIVITDTSDSIYLDNTIIAIIAVFSVVGGLCLLGGVGYCIYLTVSKDRPAARPLFASNELAPTMNPVQANAGRVSV